MRTALPKRFAASVFPIIKLGRLAIYNLQNLRVVPYETLSFFQKNAPDTVEEVFSAPKPVFADLSTL